MKSDAPVSREASKDMLHVLQRVPQAERAQGEACAQLAKSYVEMGVAEEAVSNGDRAIAFAKRSEDPMFEAEIMITVAEVNYGAAIRTDRETRKGQQAFHKYCTKAWQSAKLAKARCERFKYKELLPKALCAMGEVGVIFDVDLALSSAQEAQNLSAEVEDDLGLATAVVLQANILYHKGENSAAKSMAEKGLKFAEGAGASDLVADAQDLIQRTSAAGPSQVQEAAAVTDAPAAAEGTTVVAAAEAKKGMDPEVVQETLVTLVQQNVAEDEAVELDTPLMDAGLDSLASVAFRNAIQTQLGLQMPSSLMFDYPNVRQLTDFIVEKSTQ